MDPAASHLRHVQRDRRQIDASRGPDAIVVAPASADFLAMLAHGRAGDLLSTLCLARECPLLVAPAMNRNMWANVATQRNVAQLRADGVAILGPDTGELACKENREAGAEVLLVADRTDLPTPCDVSRVNVTSATQMAEAVLARVGETDVIIAAAAVADYTPATVHEEKVKKSGDAATIALKRIVEILATVAVPPNPPYCAGFAVENPDVERLGEKKRRRKKLPSLTAKRARAAFGRHQNELALLDDAGAQRPPCVGKPALARNIILKVPKRNGR